MTFSTPTGWEMPILPSEKFINTWSSLPRLLIQTADDYGERKGDFKGWNGGGTEPRWHYEGKGNIVIEGTRGEHGREMGERKDLYENAWRNLFLCMIITKPQTVEGFKYAGRIKKKTRTHHTHCNMEKCMANIIGPKDHTSINTELESDHILSLYITLKNTMFS